MHSVTSAPTVTFGNDVTDPDAYNLHRLTNAREIVRIADRVLENRSVRLATAGYSEPPAGYETVTTAFLDTLIDRIGPSKIGLVTSPTADAGSIDAISTLASQKRRRKVTGGLHQPVSLLYITAENYVPYINPSKFPPGVDLEWYKRTPKFVFPDPDEYSKATALGSNALLVTGGRASTVGDFVNAIKANNKVVVLDNQALGGVDWDETKKRPPNNAARYLVEQIDAFRAGAQSDDELPYPGTKGFDWAFLNEHRDQLDQLVKVVTVNSSGDIRQAARQAAAHLAS